MTVSPIDYAIRKALNDRRIFWMPQKLIDKTNWSNLKLSIKSGKTDDVQNILSKAENAVCNLINHERNLRKRRYLEDAKKLLAGFKTKIGQRSPFVTRMLDMLDEFGPLLSNLPNMEDFGKVIEGYNYSTAEQFFLYKIQKERNGRKKDALCALIEIVKELYESRANPIEIAFFVRKIDSLPQIMEVLQCQQ